MSETPIKPCPFCPGGETFISKLGTYFHRECNLCGARGPARAKRSRVNEAWNTRAETPLEALANRLADALEAEEKHQWAKRNREAISDPLDERILGLKMEVERTVHEAATLRRATLAEFAAMKEGK